MSYVDMRGMPTRDEVVAHYAEVSGRQVDDLDYYLVLAKWKLAIVLEQGFQRAGDDEKLLAFGPVVTSLMALGGRPRRVHRLPGLTAMRAAVCPEYGPPEVVRIDEHAGAGAQAPARSACGWRRRPSTSPTSCWWPTRTRSVSRRRSSRVASSPGVVDEIGPETTGFAVGDAVTGTGMFGAFAERVVVDAAGLAPIPDGVDAFTAAAFGVAHRTAYHALRSMPGCRRATNSSCSARAAASGWRRYSSASRWAPTSPRSRHRPKSWTWHSQYGATAPDQPPHGELRAALRRRCPTAPTSCSTPSAASSASPRCGRWAGAAGSSPSGSRPESSRASR